MAVSAARAKFEQKMQKPQELNQERVKVIQSKAQKLFSQDQKDKDAQDPKSMCCFFVSRMTWEVFRV
jgi:hypothetical protein